MLKVLGTVMIAVLFIGNIFAGTSHHWTLKEGEGNRVVKDSVGNLNGKMIGKVEWAREDDRGWFLNYKGGRVEVASGADINYPEGLIAQIHFSVNFAEVTKPWVCIFSRGFNYSRGWTVMLDRKGTSMLIGLAGAKPAYQSFKVNMESNRDYKLTLMLGGGKARLILNNELVTEYPITGTLAEKPDQLFIGGNMSYPFFGNIYDFKVMPYSQDAAKKLIPAGKTQVKAPAAPVRKIKYPSLNLPNPAGTVIFSDFNRLSPKPNVTTNGWLYRDNMHFIIPSAGVLNPSMSPDAAALQYDPELKGEYDVYAGVRTFTNTTSLIIGVGNDYYRISLPGTGSKTHYNIEQIIARKVDMTGKKIKLQTTGERFTIGYLKFIPSSKARTRDYPPFPGAKVEKSQPVTAETIEKKFEEKIASQIASGFFTQRHYMEKTPMPKISSASSKRGFILFNRNWMDLVWENTVPASDPGSIKLSVAAAPGETVPAAFALRALRNLKNVKVTQLTPFTAGSRKAAVNAQISVVEPARKRTTHFVGKSEFMNMPYYLEPMYEQDIKQGISKKFFLTLTLPETVLPGEYSARFAVDADGQRTVVPVQLTVYPFTLAEVKDHYFGYWTSVAANREAARKIIQDQALSANSIVVDASTLVRFKGSRRDNFAIDWDNSVLVTVAEEMKKQKMNGRIFLMTQYIWSKSRELSAADRDECYIKVIQDIMAKAKADRWPEIVFNSFDEVLSNPEKLQDFIKEVKLQKKAGAKTANDHIWYKTARPWQKEVDAVSAYIDIFINRYNTRSLWYVDNWPVKLKTAREKNVELIAYNSNNALTYSQPAAMRFVNGWFQRSPMGSGCRGQLIWTWHSFSGSPLNDLDGTDWTYMVPAYKNKKGGPTYDLMGLRAGYSDMRYILTLENAVKEAQKANKDTAKAQKLLAELSSSFDRQQFLEKSVFFNSHWSEKFERSGKRYASGVLNLPNGWSLDDYDNNRAKIARAIIELKK